MTDDTNRDALRRKAKDRYTIFMRPNDLLALLDALDQADARTARLTAQTETRRRAVAIYQQRAMEAEKRLAAVDALVTDLEQQPTEHIGWDAVSVLHDIRNTLSPDIGSPDRPCGRGICALGDGHDGPCRC